MYRVLLADPPWDFDDHLPGNARGAAYNYQCLSLPELIKFPLPPMLPDSLLFLWRVAAMQEEALYTMRQWGFTPKAEIVWLKRTKYNKRWFGMGRTVRNEHEVCLIGHRGRPTILSHSIRSTFSAPVRAHSQKPDEQYAIIEALSAGPYVELFARQHRAGWDSFGLELEATP